MQSKLDEHTLLFSHLDPEIFSPSQAPQFLPELFIATLLQRRVLLLASDLVTNRPLAEHLCANPETWALVEDLISNSDAITLLIHPLSEFRQCNLDPMKEPLQAWAWMVEHTRLFGSKEFQPTTVQTSFYRKLDSAFRRSKHHILPTSTTSSLDRENSFAIYFREILTNGFAELKKLKDFEILNSRTAHRFVELASDDSIWKEALAKAGLLPVSLEQTSFFRSAAYRCLLMFSMSKEENRAWRSLFQSVFYSDLCTRLGVRGRFGGRLHDLPLDFTLSNETRSGEFLDLRVVTDARPNFPIVTRVGDVVRRTREALSVPEEDPMESVWTSNNPEQQFVEVWASVVDTFAAFASSQEAPMSFHVVPAIWITPDFVSALGVSIKVELANLSINVLKAGYKRYAIERRLRQQLLGMAAARAVLLNSTARS